MRKFQVWVGGTTLLDIEAGNGQEARQQARELLNLARLPRGTTLYEIPHNYYKEIVALNTMQGFDATNL